LIRLLARQRILVEMSDEQNRSRFRKVTPHDTSSPELLTLAGRNNCKLLPPPSRRFRPYFGAG
jgi:hypothetical protein